MIKVKNFSLWIQCVDISKSGRVSSRFSLLSLLIFGSLINGLFFADTAHAQIGGAVRQIVVAKAASWDSNTAQLQAYQRSSARDPWQPVFAEPFPVLLGRNGLAWGRGPFNPPANGAPTKVEKDWRAPAGIFQLGTLFGYSATTPKGAKWPYHRVGQWDAYIDDPSNPYYNQHVKVDPNNAPSWFEKQRMRLGDDAYVWMLEIRHNQRPASPGHGSAIFFHVRRGPNKPSAGCTTMAQPNLERLIRWLDPKASPHYVLLPVAEYTQLRRPWALP